VKKKSCLVLLLFVLCLGSGCVGQSGYKKNSLDPMNNVSPLSQKELEKNSDDYLFLDDLDVDKLDGLKYETIVVYDPAKQVNMFFLARNDELYRNALIPTKEFYLSITHRHVQIGVTNFYQNLRTPLDVVGNILLLRLGDAGLEFMGFIVNSVTSLGFCDIFPYDDHLKNIGFDYVLESYGAPEGIFFIWPIVGPFTLRGTVGLVGDTLVSLPALLLSMPVSTSFGLINFLTQTNYDPHLDAYKYGVAPYDTIRKAVYK